MNNGTAKRKCLTSTRALTGEHEAGWVGVVPHRAIQRRFSAGPSTDIQQGGA